MQSIKIKTSTLTIPLTLTPEKKEKPRRYLVLLSTLPEFLRQFPSSTGSDTPPSPRRPL